MFCGPETIGPALTALPLWGASTAALGGIGVWAVLHLRQHRPPPAFAAHEQSAASLGQDPVAMLRERYVRGEIDLATFEHMLERLSQGGYPLR